MAGTVTLTGVLLAVLVSPWFLLLPALAGTNQLLMVVVGWCPMSLLLTRLGYGRPLWAPAGPDCLVPHPDPRPGNGVQAAHGQRAAGLAPVPSRGRSRRSPTSAPMSTPANVSMLSAINQTDNTNTHPIWP